MEHNFWFWLLATTHYLFCAQLLMATIGQTQQRRHCDYYHGTMTNCDYWRLLLWCTLYTTAHLCWWWLLATTSSILLMATTADGDHWQLLVVYCCGAQLLMVTIGQTTEQRRHGRVAWEAILQFGFRLRFTLNPNTLLLSFVPKRRASRRGRWTLLQSNPTLPAFHRLCPSGPVYDR